MENLQKYIEGLAARLKALESEMLELEELADKAVLEVKAEYQEQINALFNKKAEVQDKVSKIEKASGNAWEDMKAGAELSWEVFNETVKKAFKT
jgi:DNA repair exonuclease SbcCD ATPase subunit